MFMMRIPDNDRSNSAMDISSILELTGIVFGSSKSRWLLPLMQSCSYLQSGMVFLKKHLLITIITTLQLLTRSYLQSFPFLP
jgi:hypothetical protein